jgi:hypothetical protein
MPVDEFEEENEEAQGSDMDAEGEEKQDQAEYVKKEFVARPYASPYETDKEVQSLNPKN